MEYAEVFIMTGSIVAFSKWLSTKVNPAYVSMIAGMPLGILASFFLENEVIKKQYYKGYPIGGVIFAITVVSIYLATDYYKTVPINYFSAAGYLAWVILTFIGIKYFAVKSDKKH